MRPRRAVAVLTLASLSLLLALASRPAAATAPGKNGWIAFSRYRFVNSPLRKEIWVVNPDGSGLRQVTHAPANYLDSDPSWAPDGSRLVFSRCAPLNGSPCEGLQTIWVVNPDGKGLRQLTPTCRSATHTPSATCPQDGQAVYSPDGKQIAAARYTGVPGIAIGDSNFRQVRELFPFGSKPGAPDIDGLAWAPDGKELAFVAHNDNSKRYRPIGGRAIFIINTDGTGLHRITSWKLNPGEVGELDWSPDGNHILFHSITYIFDHGPGPQDGNLYTIHPDGTGLEQLTHFPAYTAVQLGSYSPDGTKIVFTTSQGATTSPGSAFPDVFTMNADGTNITPVTRTKNWEGTPSWGAR
jgi:Tol biopolymer transport system component